MKRIKQKINAGFLILTVIVIFLSGCTTKKVEEQGIVTKFGNSLLDMPVEKRADVVKKFISDHPETPIYEDDSIVNLYWYGKADSVKVNGNFAESWAKPENLNAAACADSTFFYITFTLPSDARVDYQFIVDGKYDIDPRNPNITPSGYGPHSQIAMPRFKPSPYLAKRPDVPEGTYDTLLFISNDTTIQQRQVLIYKPAAYDSVEAIPVIYVLDGWESANFMAYPTVVENLIADKKIKPVLVVFIPPVDRSDEYLDDVKHLANAISDELVPIIDEKYHTAAVPEERAISGISAGGHAAIYTALSRPDVFLNAAGQSPAITQQLLDLVMHVKDKNNPLPDWRIWQDAGKFDVQTSPLKGFSLLESTKLLHEKLDGAGIKNKLMIVDDGHEWASWRERTDDILMYLFAPRKNE